jgi:hypothetical protein
MKEHGLTALGAGLVASAALTALLTFGASPALGQSTTATTVVKAPPIQGAGPHQIVLYVDTVTGGGAPKPVGLCLEENQFVQGQLVVFRMYAYDVTAGGLALTDRNTEAAYVTIPGRGKIPMKYAANPKDHLPAYWEVPWSSKGYPVGTVNFTVTVVAKPLADWGIAAFATSTVPAQAGVFRQVFYAGSGLTIVAP